MNAGRGHIGLVCKKRDTDGPNALFMWGSNKYGQLGLWDFEARDTPTFVDSEFDPT